MYRNDSNGARANTVYQNTLSIRARQASSPSIINMGVFNFDTSSLAFDNAWGWDHWYMPQLRITITYEEDLDGLSGRLMGQLDGAGKETWGYNTLTYNSNQGLMQNSYQFNRTYFTEDLGTFAASNVGQVTTFSYATIRDIFVNDTNSIMTFGVESTNNNQGVPRMAALKAELLLVPEPTTTIMFALGLSILVFSRKRTKTH